MKRQEFRETLLGFLGDVTSISDNARNGFLSGDCRIFWRAPDGYILLNNYLLVKEGTLGRGTGAFMVDVKLFTENYVYSIVAVHRNVPKSYLGLTAMGRTWRAGENWNRFKDLYDGDFSKETWSGIKDDIIRTEMKGLSKYLTGGHYPCDGEDDGRGGRKIGNYKKLWEAKRKQAETKETSKA